MPAHRVKLTNKGFRTISTDFFLDGISFTILIALTCLSLFQNFSMVPYFSIFSIISLLVFFLYRTKNGYLYPFHFFYHILLFWIITPPIFINYYTIPIAGVLVAGYFYLNNPFQKIYFPLGLALSLFVVAIVLLFGKGSLSIQMLEPGEQLKGLQIDSIQISGYFFQPIESPTGYFNTNSYSLIEKFSFLTPILLFTLVMRQKNVFLDFILILGMAGMSLNFFGENVEFIKSKPLAVLSTWYLIFSAPGRNRGFSADYSLIALAITGILALTIIKENNGFPPIALPTCFFFCQSFLYVLTQDSLNFKMLLNYKIFRNEPSN